jgi:hypothetical protein
MVATIHELSKVLQVTVDELMKLLAEIIKFAVFLIPFIVVRIVKNLLAFVTGYWYLSKNLIIQPVDVWVIFISV